MLPTKFQFILSSGCREDFLEIEQPETRIAYGECHLLTSVGVRRPLDFHILIFSSETSYLNEPKHICEILYKDCSFRSDTLTNINTRFYCS
jgi:hypothetical protein